MFKRRLAVLGTAAALALTGLGGSAMADETPTGEAPAAAVTCTTSDGHTVKFAEPAQGKVMITRNGDDVSAPPEGEPGHMMMKVMPATPASPTSPAETVAPDEAVESAPALPAPPDLKVEDLAKTVKIMCKAEKPAE
ncbi:MAG: hypothetical protein HOY71_02860 [Nonomuraea sp.]|nr:hypothetical protein [Nonomuraea sp.]